MTEAALHASGGAQTAPSVRAAPPPPIHAVANVDHLNALPANAAIELSLSRPLAPDEGELALVVGGVDVTAVSQRSPSRITYQPTALMLPAGETELVLYSRAHGRWSEIRRLSVRVLAAAGATGFST